MIDDIISYRGVFMNKKGFTLVELLSTIVILGIVVGLSIVAININIKKTKEKSEDK